MENNRFDPFNGEMEGYLVANQIRPCRMVFLEEDISKKGK